MDNKTSSSSSSQKQQVQPNMKADVYVDVDNNNNLHASVADKDMLLMENENSKGSTPDPKNNADDDPNDTSNDIDAGKAGSTSTTSTPAGKREIRLVRPGAVGAVIGAVHVYPSGHGGRNNGGHGISEEFAVSVSPPCDANEESSVSAGPTPTLPTLLDAHVFDEAAERSMMEEQISKRMRQTSVEASKIRRISVSEKRENQQGNLNSELLQQQRKRQQQLLVGMFGFGLLAVIVALSVGFTYGRNNSTPTTTSMQDVEYMEYIRQLLIPLSGNETLYDETSDQYAALRWLLYDDPSLLASELMKHDLSIVRDKGDGDEDEEDEDEGSQNHASKNKNKNVLMNKLLERYAVVTMYHAMGGEDWSIDLNFLSNASVCDWPDKSSLLEEEVEDANNAIEGIVCDESDSVTSIVLDAIGVNGTIPIEISALSSLEKFQCVSGDLHGTLPTEMGDKLSRLQTVRIYHTQLSGTIPQSFSKLTKLETFGIAYASITGTIPAGMPQITSLEFFMLAFTMLTGTIPEFGPSEDMKLSRLLLEGAFLSGTIPETIYGLTNLKLLRLFNNEDLTGTLSTRIGQLTNLEFFEIQNDSLYGELPTEIGLLRDAYHFGTYGNQFTGTLPTEIGEMERLQYLVMSFNGYRGPIPSELGNLDRLSNVYLTGNEQINGTIPARIAELTSLAEFHVGNTSLSYDAFDAFCNEPSRPISVFLEGDCYGDDPEVNCTCCASCYDPVEEMSVTDIPAVCELDVNLYNYEEGRNTSCGCSTTNITGTKMFCTEACQSCNRDGTICAVNNDFGFGYDAIGRWNSSWATFQYVKGLNDTVDFQLYIDENSIRNCDVRVNGDLCRRCEYVRCADQFQAYRVRCDNVDGVGNIDLCDGISNGGALSLFEMQDELQLEGCSPFFPQV